MEHIYQEYTTSGGISEEKKHNALAIINNAKKIARAMAANYNQKKKAFELSKTSYHNTGSLDISRLHSYRTSDDIFRKNSTLKEGNSHGIVCALDFSISMRDMLPKMAIQFLIMSLFCKYSDIHFTFFTYTSGSRAGMPTSDGNAIFTDIGNNTMKESKFIEIFYHILSYSELQQASLTNFTNKYKSYLRSIFTMDLTPLHSAVFQSFLVAKQMQNSGIQNVNILVINDGDNNRYFRKSKDISKEIYSSIEDPFNKRVYSVNSEIKKKNEDMLISPMNRMIRDNGIKIMNMYLGDFRNIDIKSLLSKYIINTDIIDLQFISNNSSEYSKDIGTKGYTEIKNLCYYDSVLFVDSNVFPDLGNKDNYKENIIKSHTQKIKALSLIGKLLSDKMVEDFKLLK